MKKLIFALFGASMLVGCATAQPVQSQHSEPNTQHSISGDAFLGSVGGPDKLQGLPVYLCFAEKQDYLKPIITPSTQLSHDLQYDSVMVSLNRANELAKEKNVCPYSTTTSIDGHYSFEDIKPGDYIVFSNWKNDSSVSMWNVPVSITGDAIKVDLTPANRSLEL